MQSIIFSLPTNVFLIIWLFIPTSKMIDVVFSSNDQTICHFHKPDKSPPRLFYQLTLGPGELTLLHKSLGSET